MLSKVSTPDFPLSDESLLEPVARYKSANRP